MNDLLDLMIYSDFGRILNPLIIVHYDKNGNPYTNLTKEAIERILSGKSTIDWLLESQIIEYVSVEEAHNCLVADSFTSFLRKLDP